MRYIAFLFAIILMAASGAGAQVNFSSYALTSSPFSGATATPPPIGQNVFMPAIFADPALLPPAPAAEPQGIQGVFQNYSWQAYVGYTFLRAYVVPGTAVNQNGLNGSVVWFYRDWIGFDGELLGTYGRLSGDSSWTFFAGAGPRLRYTLPRGLEVFAHGLIGYAHLTPQTPFGSENAFAYEVGGGVDLMPPHHRFGYRLEADMLGTRYFGVYQYSPKISAGVVFKF
ncbi:MAG TPA: hypothetical protein VN901_09870 [Candidatus Acidoferrales bacterium]|jgi:hypothetical protein|nr:hypothetical protein [Candidatus Acidoferrales bacterium]